jgi:polyferredoxin
MTKLSRRTGLIRYDSAHGFAGKKTRYIRPRIIVYSILLTVGAAVTAFSVSTFRPAMVTLSRMVGEPYILTDDGVRNQYFLRVINKENRPEIYQVRITGDAPGMQTSGTADLISAGALGEQICPLVVTVPRAQFRPGMTVTVVIDSADKRFHSEQQLPFLGPNTP